MKKYIIKQHDNDHKSTFENIISDLRKINHFKSLLNSQQNIKKSKLYQKLIVPSLMLDLLKNVCLLLLTKSAQIKKKAEDISLFLLRLV